MVKIKKKTLLLLWILFTYKFHWLELTITHWFFLFLFLQLTNLRWKSQVVLRRVKTQVWERPISEQTPSLLTLPLTTVHYPWTTTILVWQGPHTSQITAIQVAIATGIWIMHGLYTCSDYSSYPSYTIICVWRGQNTSLIIAIIGNYSNRNMDNTWVRIYPFWIS